MFKTALLPQKLNVQPQKIETMLNFLKSFGTKKIFILNVTSTESKKNYIKEKMIQKLEQLEIPNFKFEFIVKEGEVGKTICDFAKQNNIDFIYTPWNHKFPFYEFILGSDTSDIVRLSEVPVFIYKKKAVKLTNENLYCLLYATDFKATDSYILPYLNSFSILFQKLIILNVGKRAADPFSEKKRLEIIQNNLDRLKAEFVPPFKQCETIASIGRPSRKILQQAKKSDVDLIVAGKFDESPIQQALGSTAVNLADKTKHSLLIIPSELKPTKSIMERIH